MIGAYPEMPLLAAVRFLQPLCARSGLKQSLFEGFQTASKKFVSCILLFFFLGPFFIGCNKKSSLPTLIDSARPALANLKTMELEVSKVLYRTQLRDPTHLIRLRVIPITNRGDASSKLPEYRLFNVVDNSPAYLLGLRNADIVVAANGYLIYSHNKFKSYLALLSNESDASIEIRREGEPIVLKVRFK